MPNKRLQVLSEVELLKYHLFKFDSVIWLEFLPHGRDYCMTSYDPGNELFGR